MNRRIVTAAAVLALSVGAISLLAQRPGRPGGRGRGGPGGPGPGGPGIFALVNQLDLTDAQREQIRAAAEEGREANHPGTAIRAAEQKLHAAVLADTPDLQAIDSLKATLNAAQAAELDHRVEMLRRVAQILTPAQRQQLLQLQPQGPPRGRGPGRR
jgi:Spy/CpxP family protein refolding chaperone